MKRGGERDRTAAETFSNTLQADKHVVRDELPHRFKTVDSSGGDLAPSLGGTEKIVADLNDVFPEKMSIFTPNISYDLFLVIDQVFQILRFFTVLNVVYHPFFLHHKDHYFRKEFLDKTIFLLCSYFRAHPTTLLL